MAKKVAKKKPTRKKTALKKTSKKTSAIRKARKNVLKKNPAAKAVGKTSSVVVTPAPALPWRQPLPGETFIGVVEDYFGHLGVVALTLNQPLAVGDRIHVRGHTTDLIQVIESMQIGHQGVQAAGPKDSVGLKVGDKCRNGDYVYRYSP